MLTDLRVAGLALLEDCELELGPGLTAITGETGAGKTMLLTALRLLTGGRADPKIITPTKSRTEIDASLTVPENLATELEEAGLTTDEGEATFSRTVTASRSRAAINGRPVTAKTLQETAGRLITIHGQADQWKLRSPSHQRDLLDSYAPQSHHDLLGRYRDKWNETKQLRDAAEELSANRDRLLIELRYLQEIIGEVDALDPVEGEEDLLIASIDRLSNVEELRSFTTSALEQILGREAEFIGAVDLIGNAAENLRRAADLGSDLDDVSSRARALEADAASLAADLRAYGDLLADDPDELARLHQRLATLTELCRGRARDARDLIHWAKGARARVAELQDVESDPLAAQKRLERAETELDQLAGQVTDSRREAASDLAEKVNKELKKLALADAKLVVSVEDIAPTASGANRVEMLLQAHPTSAPTPLAEGASGGELSRVMLALEVVLAGADTPQTMIFDEVDAGVGGLTANQVGQRLKQLSRFHQVIVVTHLPQIAALANGNFVVEKAHGRAKVRAVEAGERTEEIIRMLGGDDSTGAARRHALELEKGADMEESTP